MLIATVWVVSLGISIAPHLGWKDPDYLDRIDEGTCLVSQDAAYQVSASGELQADPKCFGVIATGNYSLANAREWIARESGVDASANIYIRFSIAPNYLAALHLFS